MSAQEVVHAYRHLYRYLLRAVQFQPRARLLGRNKLRAAFRERSATFDKLGVQRTIWFLKAASEERGLEHKIVKNLLKTEASRQENSAMPWKIQLEDMEQGGSGKRSAANAITKHAYDHYDMSIAMLNKTMGLCLR